MNVTNGDWYVVQTNSDHWDAGCYNRCESAREKLDKLGQDAVDINVLRDKVLMAFPNQNYESLFNSQLVPSDGLIDTIDLNYAGEQKEAEVAHGREYEKDFFQRVSHDKRFVSKDAPNNVLKQIKGLSYFELAREVFKFLTSSH